MKFVRTTIHTYFTCVRGGWQHMFDKGTLCEVIHDETLRGSGSCCLLRVVDQPDYECWIFYGYTAEVPALEQLARAS